MTNAGTNKSFQSAGRGLMIACLIAATAFFAIRGPARSLSYSADLFLIYAASRAWLIGANPYDASEQWQAVTTSHAKDSLPGLDLISLYPPTMFVIMAPVSWASWPSAKIIWAAINLLAMGALLVGMLRWARLNWREPRGVALIGLMLTFGPIITGFNMGQTALTCTAMLVWALHLHADQRRLLAGGLMGLAIALKPQLAGLFWLYWLARGQWRTCAVSVAVWVGIAAIALAQLGVTNLAWAHDLLANLRDFGAVGGLASADASNPLRYQLINLAYPVQALVHQIQATTAIVAATVIALLASTWYRLIRPSAASSNQALLTLSVLAVITLLATYHRTYDAVLLVFPLAWALGPGWRSIAGRIALGCILVFMLPIPIILNTVADRGWISPDLVASWGWQSLVLPSTAWMLPVLAITLLIAAKGRAQG